MKTAWRKVKSYRMNISAALKQSWKEAKESPALFAFSYAEAVYMEQLRAKREAREQQPVSRPLVVYASDYATMGAESYYHGAGSYGRYYGD